METFYECIVKNIENYKRKIANDGPLDFFFRGHNEAGKRLKTKLQRSGKNFNEIRSNYRWDNSCTTFENLAKMQHYDEPTRMLDYTTDYNVALYFACSDKNQINKDGELFVCSYLRRNFEAIDVKLITELDFLDREVTVKEFITSFLKKYPSVGNDEDTAEKLGLRVLSWIDHGIMVTPSSEEMEILKKKNIRVYNQKGVFFIQGNQLKQPHMKRTSATLHLHVILPKLVDLPTTITYPGFIKQIVIPKEEKNNILEILDKKGINEKFLFPDK